MDPYLMLWHSSWTYAIGCTLPEDDLKWKVETRRNKNGTTKQILIR
jgi:hypothetical protein